jgi:uncharacterized membrane protein (UPF0127 family)
LARQAVFAAAVLLVCLVPGAAAAETSEPVPVAGPTQPLKISSSGRVHSFAVEMAQTDEQRSRGLMYRKSLPAGRGMLFDFKQEQPVAFWMKNTYVSLDMIFIRADGTILNIAENTEPLSEKMVPAAGPVRGVLEVVAGTTSKLGIKPGDKVAHPIFSGR